jgi:hypothetical protein
MKIHSLDDENVLDMVIKWLTLNDLNTNKLFRVDEVKKFVYYLIAIEVTKITFGEEEKEPGWTSYTRRLADWYFARKMKKNNYSKMCLLTLQRMGKI